MKWIRFLLPLLMIMPTVHGQFSIFDCSYTLPLTQAEINTAYLLYRPCVFMGGGQSYTLQGNTSHEIISSTEIHITGDQEFHAGNFSSGGNLWLRVFPDHELDVAVMNYPSLSGIAKYEKFELGITLPPAIQTKVDNFLHDLPGDKVNPFLDEEIRVFADFYHPASGTVKTIDGFYYRNMQRHLADSSWVDSGTTHPFRIRYAPPKTGQWQCNVRVSVGGVEIPASGIFTFDVVESGNPGYVTKHPNGKNFSRGGELIFPLGQNFAWPFAEQADGIEACNTSDWVGYLANIENYADLGGKYIRVLTHPRSMDIEWEKVGNYYDRLHYASEMDNLIELAEEKDLLVEFNIMMHQQIMQVADYCTFKWDFSNYFPSGNTECVSGEPGFYQPYAYRSQLGITTPQQMFTDPVALKFLKQRARYLVSRYGYSTNIYLFELLSEAYHLGYSETDVYTCNDTDNDGDQDWTCGPVPGSQNNAYGNDPNTRAALYNYHNVMSHYIRNTMNHNEQLIGVSYGWSRGNDSPNDPANFVATANPFYPMDGHPNHGSPDHSFSLNTVDVISLNFYVSLPDKLINSNDGNVLHSVEDQIQELRTNYGKLIMMSEAGHGDGYDGCANGHAYNVDVMTIPFSGMAAMNMWAGVIPDPVADYNRLIKAQDHMNSPQLINVLNSDWAHRMLESSDEAEAFSEFQMYISQNQEKAAGYVKNRTFNVFTENNGQSPCTEPTSGDNNSGARSFWSSIGKLNFYATMELSGLKNNTDYRIYWFDYAGNSVGYHCFTTNIQGKALVTSYPLYPLIANPGPGEELNPIRWFTIEQFNCRRSQEFDPVWGANTEEDHVDKPLMDITLYPNPTTGVVHIKATEPIRTVEVFSSLGTLITTFYLELGGRESDLMLSSLPAGVYYLRVNQNANLFKLIKI